MAIIAYNAKTTAAPDNEIAVYYYMRGGMYMRTTLELPDVLVDEAMALTKITTETELVKYALENVIQREKIRGLEHYFGKITLDIDLDKLRRNYD